MSTQDLVLHLGADGPEYGTIHDATCSAPLDPEPIGTAVTKDQACRLAEHLTHWAQNDGQHKPYDTYQFAPCVTLERRCPRS